MAKKPAEGATQTRTRMSAETIKEIKSDLAGGLSTASAATKYGKSIATISNIRRKMRDNGAITTMAKASGPDDNSLRKRLQCFAMQYLLHPERITEEQTAALKEELQTDIEDSYNKTF